MNIHVPRFRIRKLGGRWSLQDTQGPLMWCVFFETQADAIRYIDYRLRSEREARRKLVGLA